MKITDVHIDGFGVWHDLQLDGISPQLTAFYGANEAGKTTLMQFLRSVLYGVSTQRRSRYLPPVNGGRAGGTLNILDGQSPLIVSRFADRDDEDHGLVSIIDAEGHTSGDRLLRDALADIDEVTYENIFALGLGEIQQLGTLSGTQAAQWLYRLTSGLDRVSLYDVIQGLNKTRLGLLAGREEDSKIAHLLARREVLHGEIGQLTQQNKRWSQLVVRIEELDAEIIAQEAEVAAAEHQARTIELAVGLKENWRRRAKITAQLNQSGGTIQLPDDATTRLDAINRKLEERQREADILEGQRRQLAEETDRLGINELLMKSACRIDALGEQRDWLQSLDRQIEHLDEEAHELQSRFTTEQERLATTLGVTRSGHLHEITISEFESLEPLLDEIESAQKKIEQASHELSALTENERSLKSRVESAVVAGEQHKLPMDLEEASDLVARLRRRLQVEQRLDQARSHQVDLEHQSQELLEEQVMPLWLFGWTLAAVVLGMLLVGLWLWVPNNPLGDHASLIALGGLSATIFMFVLKYFIEDAAAEKLDACQRQMESLSRKIDEAERDKKLLDAELPLTDGSVVLRLQAAEKHLAELENVLPVEAQRKRAGHEVTSAETRLAQATAQYEKSLAAWKSKLLGLGFSDKLNPLHFVSAKQRFTALGDLEERVKLRHEEILARQREHATLTRRIRDLAQEVGCVLKVEETEGEANALDQLEHLIAERGRQLSDVQRREELHERAKELKSEEDDHRQAIEGLRRRRDTLFQAADCEDEAAYRRLIEDQQQAQKLRSQRKRLTREIAAAIGNHASEEEFAELLAPESIERLDTLWEEFSSALEQAQTELKSLVDKRGAMREQQRTLVEDRSLPQCQLDLSCLEKQLDDARHAWREHATVSRVLERVRHHYEANRQPETLAEATRYFSQLSGGEYRRVWTPIADDILLVENSAGESLTVDNLSRGTREQLFLSIRLAVVSTFAKRGVKLPMVLDDVLVNFDAIRAQRAAAVLKDFAAGGHQVLLFTCHEHMWQMFQSLEVDCRRLPNRFGTVQDVVKEVPDEPLVEDEVKPARDPKRTRKSRRVKVQEIVAPEPIDFYDYPFVERIEEEVIRTPVTQTLPAVTEYTVPQSETTYEWLVDTEEEEYQTQVYDHFFHDHLETRRA